MCFYRVRTSIPSSTWPTFHISSLKLIRSILCQSTTRFEKETQAHGVEVIDEKYPSLRQITEHLIEIKQEIRIWKTKQ